MKRKRNRNRKYENKEIDYGSYDEANKTIVNVIIEKEVEKTPLRRLGTH